MSGEFTLGWPAPIPRRRVLAALLLSGAGLLLPGRSIAAAGDDSAALNAELARTGRLRLAANRSYLLRNPLRVRDGDQIVGHRTSVIRPEGNFPAIIVEGRGAVLDGFTITGARDSYPSSGAHGVLIDWRKVTGGNIRIVRIRVASVSGSGIIALASARTRAAGLTVADCEVVETGAHGIIAQDYIDNVLIERNLVRATGLGTPDRPGITGSRYGAGVIIRDNRCYGSPAAKGSSVHGISLDHCRDAQCYGNVVNGWTRGYGIEVGGVHSGTVTNNRITRGRYGIGIPGVVGRLRNERVRLTANMIEDMSAAGIYVFMANGDGRYLHRQLEFRSNIVRRVTGNDIGIGALLTDIDGLIVDQLTVTGSRKSGISLIDCANYDLRRLDVSGNNLRADPAHAGLAVRWLRVPAARRGRLRSDAAMVRDNGGIRNVMQFQR